MFNIDEKIDAFYVSSFVIRKNVLTKIKNANIDEFKERITKKLNNWSLSIYSNINYYQNEPI